MNKIKKIFLIADKEKRYDKFVFWFASEIFKNKISILEHNFFSDTRKVRCNNTKLIGSIIYSKDPESSAFIGSAIKVMVFENYNDKTWKINLIFIEHIKSNLKYKDLDFFKFINEERIKIITDFISK